MKTLISIIAIALLAGCATTSNVPKTVEVPIAVACKTPDPAVPDYRFSPPYKDTFSGTRDLLGDRDQALAYEIQMRAALKSCK